MVQKGRQDPPPVRNVHPPLSTADGHGGSPFVRPGNLVSGVGTLEEPVNWSAG